MRDAWIENNIVILDENVTQDGKFKVRITKTSITGASVLFKDGRVNWNLKLSTIQGKIKSILGIKQEEI
jgi:hypothetical protein